jgi:AraC family transcriptional regulator
MRPLSPREQALILEYIDERLEHRLLLADLAAVVGLRPSHFKTLFKRSLGVPVHQYVIRRRVDRAAELLAQHGVRLGDAAEAAGFADPSHMARAMRRLIGMTPSEIARDARLGQVRNHPSERPEMEPKGS